MTDQNVQPVLTFDGRDYVEIADPFESNTTFTISLWLRPTAINDNRYHGFIGKQGDPHRKPGLWVCPSDSGLHYDSYTLEGERYSDMLNHFFEAKDQWVHIAWVKEGTEYRFYRNGELFATRPAPAVFYTTQSSYWIGRVDNFFFGQIAEVRIWNRVCSQEDIKATLHSRLQGNESGLVGYWHLNEGSGNVTLDKTGKGREGAINGAIWEQQNLDFLKGSEQKTEWETRAANCKNAGDFVTLAREVLAQSDDKEYARELLKKAEIHCQFPLDYIQVAEVFAKELQDTAYAKGLYEQAEEACFESKEFAEVGYSIAVHLGDKAKGTELLKKAAETAKELNEFLKLAEYAEKGLQDAELAKTLLGKVEEKCKSVEDFRKLAASVLQEQNDAETARALYRKGARYCGDVASTVLYAQGVQELFKDDSWASQILNDAETDCQFPKDFVALASGFKNLLNDSNKAGELLQQAADFAMAGDEHLEVARGYWTLLQNREAAATAYSKAIAEINDRTQLLSLAKTVATELRNPELAKKIYAKVESKSASAADFAKLAQAICDDLQDKDYAADLYHRADTKLTNTNDLISLAGEILKNLGDREHAEAVYRKALLTINDFNSFIKLLNSVQEQLNDKLLASDILDRTVLAATTTPEFLEITERAISVLESKDFASRTLLAAEERVTSLEEMRKVAETVNQYFADNAEWVARVTEKLEKRVANQAKYAEFQKREEACHTLKHYLHLTEEVMSELEDPFYAGKLLATAEKLLEATSFNFDTFLELILAIDTHLKDQSWVKRLFDYAAQQCKQFAGVRQVGQSAATLLSDKEFGKQLARTYYQNNEQQIHAKERKTVYDYTKLCTAVYEDLGDELWAKALLDKADALESDHFAAAHIGQLAETLKDMEWAERSYQKAAEKCTTALQFSQLAKRLSAQRVNSERLRRFYGVGLNTLKNPQEQLQWAEGIVELLKEQEWAKQVYDQIGKNFTSPVHKSLYAASRKHKLEKRL